MYLCQINGEHLGLEDHLHQDQEVLSLLKAKVLPLALLGIQDLLVIMEGLQIWIMYHIRMVVYMMGLKTVIIGKMVLMT